MTSGRDEYLENLNTPINTVCDQCGEWYRFDDKMRHVAYQRIVCYNKHNGYCEVRISNRIDEFGYDDFDENFTHWMPLVFPR